jgi:hypothetical protein
MVRHPNLWTLFWVILAGGRQHSLRHCFVRVHVFSEVALIAFYAGRHCAVHERGVGVFTLHYCTEQSRSCGTVMRYENKMNASIGSLIAD